MLSPDDHQLEERREVRVGKADVRRQPRRLQPPPRLDDAAPRTRLGREPDQRAERCGGRRDGARRHLVKERKRGADLAGGAGGLDDGVVAVALSKWFVCRQVVGWRCGVGGEGR